MSCDDRPEPPEPTERAAVDQTRDRCAKYAGQSLVHVKATKEHAVKDKLTQVESKRCSNRRMRYPRMSSSS